MLTAMKIFESLEITEKFRNPVLTIGNYDGIHLGHRTIIEVVKQRAAEISGTPMLMTFHPHPLQIVRPEKELPSIAPLEERKALIEEAGVDVLFIVPFTREFSQVPAEVFVRDILVGRIGLKGLVIGYDFTFGKGGSGNPELLGKLARNYGFFLEVVEAVTINGEKVGSNKIRKLVREGELDKANAFLGRPYMIKGEVVRGRGRGRQIGFPTINLKTYFALIPKQGVYVSELEWQGKRYPSVTNIGYSPTFGENEFSIESYLLDFDGELYGAEVKLFFLHRLRSEMKFESVDVLRKQIQEDVEAAWQYVGGC